MPAFDINGHYLVFKFARSMNANLGSARASRAGDGAVAIANFLQKTSAALWQVRFGGAPKPARGGACAPQHRVSLTTFLLQDLEVRYGARFLSLIES
jgi:hypothetical protein